jgi:hypothetical protein
MASQVNQALQSPFNVSVLQVVVAIGLVQLIFRSALTDLVAQRLTEMTNDAYGAVRRAIYDFPVIALASGVTFVAHHLGTQHLPSLSLSTQPEITGTLKVTAFVAGVFALNAALTAYLMRVTAFGTDDILAFKNEKYRIRATIVHNLFPVAAGTAVAYYTGFPVKLVPSALYTAGLVAGVKLLGKGFEWVLAQERVKQVVDKVYALTT